jgi:hypothetical protein
MYFIKSLLMSGWVGMSFALGCRPAGRVEGGSRRGGALEKSWCEPFWGAYVLLGNVTNRKEVVMANANVNYTSQAKATSGINLLLGAWLVASPWIFAYSTLSAAAWDSVVVGALIFIIGLTRVVSLVGPLLARVNVVLGLWTIASPWIFAYANGEPAMWNSVAVGIAVTILALWSANATVLRNRRETHLPV